MTARLSVLRLVLPSAIALAVVIELALQAEPFVFRELLTAFDSLYLVLGLAISVATLFLRGLRLACVACPKPFEFAPAAWIRLSAQHQMIFLILPSGIGDASFPLLAQKLVKMDFGKRRASLQDIACRTYGSYLPLVAWAC